MRLGEVVRNVARGLAIESVAALGNPNLAVKAAKKLGAPRWQLRAAEGSAHLAAATHGLPMFGGVVDSEFLHHHWQEGNTLLEEASRLRNVNP